MCPDLMNGSPEKKVKKMSMACLQIRDRRENCRAAIKRFFKCQNAILYSKHSFPSFSKSDVWSELVECEKIKKIYK